MKSIVLLLFLLAISIFAFIKQDQVVDVFMGPRLESQETVTQTQESLNKDNNEISKENLSVDNTKEQDFNYLDFQSERSLDEDFKINLKDESIEKEISNSNLKEETTDDFINKVFDLKNFESKNIVLTNYSEYKFLEIEDQLIEILKADEDLKVGEITLLKDIKESSVSEYFKTQTFDLIQDADNQGVYVENFEQSFFTESFKLIGFQGLDIYDYYLLKKDSKIVILKILSEEKDENFEKIIISSIRLK